MPVGRMDRSPASDLVALKQRAVRAGLDHGAGAVRVVRATEDALTRDRLRAAIERGDLATWRYDARYARRAANPQTILAHARSVLCVAVPYATPAPAPQPLRGRVSNYAWSQDYHRQLRPMLTAIARTLDAWAGAPVSAIALDTAPLAERALAARAGLGWVGKHTNLISPELGSFVFLGEVITTLDLPDDEPLRKNCGSCARCINACPTGALRGDYTMDATRCISDLTQRTDAIPHALRAFIGEWVWGCDLCQLVCPPTQHAAPAVHPSHRPASPDSSRPGLLSLLHLRHGEFARSYKNTAMGWRGAAVLRRNAAVALGNSLDRSTVGALAKALTEDPHALVRGHVAWALGRIGSPQAVAALQERAATESDASVREEIRLALKPFAGDVSLE
jgi:epoxyqueuosine reductase